MNLIDVELGHLVGRIDGNWITSRWGHSFAIKGYAVVDCLDELVGTYQDGLFSNIAGEPMARTSEHLA